MPQKHLGQFFLEEENCQLMVIMVFTGRQAGILKILDSNTKEEIEKSDWPPLYRIEELMAAHEWAYENDPDRAVSALLVERQNGFPIASIDDEDDQDDDEDFDEEGNGELPNWRMN